MRLEVVLCVQSAMANSDGTELLHGQNVHRVVSEEEGETDKEHQEEEEEEEKKTRRKRIVCSVKYAGLKTSRQIIPPKLQTRNIRRRAVGFLTPCEPHTSY